MHYFAFGSNLLPARLQARTPSAEPLRTETLTGWRLVFHKRGEDGSGKGDIVQTGKPLDRVIGVVYELSPVEKETLDRIEGLGRGYNERRLPSAEGGEMSFYVADTSAIDPQLQPFHWYHRYVIAGARWHGFPDAYVEEIARVVAISDPDRSRAEKNWAVLRSVGMAPESSG